MLKMPREDIREQFSDIQKTPFGQDKVRAKSIVSLEEAGSLHDSGTLTRKSTGAENPKDSIPHPAPTLGPDLKGEEMHFMVALSENLLLKCRKWRAENAHLKAKLKTLYDEIAQCKNEIVVLTSAKSFATNNETESSDKNLELQTHVWTLDNQLEALKLANDKLVKLYNDITLSILTFQHKIDDLTMKCEELAAKLCQAANLHAISDEDYARYTKLETDYERPPKDYLTTKANEIGLTVLETKFYDELVARADNPSFDHLQSKAVEKGLVVIPKDEHANLVAPSIEVLSEKARPLNHTVIPDLEHASLSTLAHGPSIDHLTAKSTSHNYVAISENDCPLLVIPTLEDLDKKPAKLKCSLMSVEEFDSLHQLASSPTVEQIRDRGKGHTVVLDDQLARRSLQAESRSLTEAQKHVDTVNLVTLTASEYTDLLRKANEPSVEFLTAKAAERALEMVMTSYIENLQRLAESLNLEHLEGKGGEKDHTLVEEDTIEELQTTVETLSLPHLTEKAQQTQMRLISAHDQGKPLQEVVLSSVDHTKTKTTSHDHMNVFKHDLNQLQQKINEPALEKLNTGDSKLNDILLPTSDLDPLQLEDDTPTLDELKTKVQLHDRVLTESSELSELQVAAEEPDFERIPNVAAKLGHAISTHSDSDELSKLAEPSHEHIRTKAGELDSKAIAEKENKELVALAKSPKVDHLANIPAEYEHVVIPQREHAELQKVDLEPSLVHSKVNAGDVGHVVIKQTGFNQPSHDCLHENVQSHIIDLVTSEEHENLKEQVENSPHEYLHENTSKLALVPISSNKHQRLRDPLVEQIHKIALVKGLVAVPKNDYVSLKDDAHTPSQLTVVSESLGLGLTADATTEFPLIQRLATEPTIVELSPDDKKPNHTVLAKVDHDNMKKPKYGVTLQNVVGAETKWKHVNDLAYKPSANHMGSAVDKHGCVVFPKTENETTKQFAHTPFVDNIKTTAARHDVSVIPDSELMALRKWALEHLGKVAEKYDHVVIPKKELKSLHEKAHTPDIQHLQANAAARKHVVTSSVEHQDLQALAHTSDIQQIETNARKHNLTEWSQEDDNNLVTLPNWTDADQVDKHANRLGLATADKEELSTTKCIAEDPLFDIPMRHAASRELVTIPSENFETHPENKKRARNVKLVPNEEYERLVQLSTEPLFNFLVEKAKKYDSIIVDKGKFDELKATSNQPSIDFLVGSAAVLGYKMVKLEDYDAALSNSVRRHAPVPSLDHTTEKTKEQSHEVFSQSTHDEYQQPLEKKIDTASLIALPIDDRTQLVALAKNVSDYLTGEAPKLLAYEDAAASMVTAARSEVDILLDNLSPVAADVKLTHSGSSQTVDSLVDSLTGLSIATNISFTDKTMVSAISQIMIGEYLFKYHRRLGPLSPISANRHKRYFWVHPYLVTLYWSTSSAVLTNPADIKTKAVVIVSIESIEDNNPLPTGLYHKSIIVHSQGKQVKITCPTRQRHNIWYNSLRYLVGRGGNTLNF